MSLESLRAASIMWCWEHGAQSTHPTAKCCQYEYKCVHHPTCDVTPVLLEEIDLAALGESDQ